MWSPRVIPYNMNAWTCIVLLRATVNLASKGYMARLWATKNYKKFKSSQPWNHGCPTLTLSLCFCLWHPHMLLEHCPAWILDSKTLYVDLKCFATVRGFSKCGSILLWAPPLHPPLLRSGPRGMCPFKGPAKMQTHRYKNVNYKWPPEICTQGFVSLVNSRVNSTCL